MEEFIPGDAARTSGNLGKKEKQNSKLQNEETQPLGRKDIVSVHLCVICVRELGNVQITNKQKHFL